MNYLSNSKTFLSTLALSALIIFPAFGADPASANMTAREIMEKVDAVDDGNNATQDMEMILVDKNDNTRERLLRSYRRDAGPDGEDTESIMFFLSPADVKDTGFLTYDYDDINKDDDQWLYLPALKKTKRIASSDKSGSFMGSDFTYADMTKRNIDNYDYKILKEDEVDGHKVWVIESTPNNEKEMEETGYTKSVAFVRQDNFIVVRGVNWVKKGNKLKYMDIQKLEQIDGIWVGTEIMMKTTKGKKTEHKTIIRAKNVRFNQPLDDEIFSLRQLEK
ncbi:MAG: outer membrane lipoprotein-sorting protein, partial [Pseudomonadales bacterium]|nr:outer membrane lipoprotein-sorting protein [Pseudomonadales bacterium]